MYCPKCATKNADDARFCRACGANISLVSQALEGRLPSGNAPDWWKEVEFLKRAELEKLELRRKKKMLQDPPSLEGGIVKIFTGLGFLLVALSIFVWAPAGHLWWFWMLIPAFTCFGKGISQIVRWQREEHRRSAIISEPDAKGEVNAELPRAPVLQMSSSVTEGTTKLFDRGESAPSSRYAGPVGATDELK
jgi:hypothetical protein